jgi:transcriptional regulator with XRE-family HTH domain
MAADETPAGARHRLRIALRRAREETGLTQSQVADALESSLSKVQRIESGEVSVSNSDLKALIALYGITDSNRVDQLVQSARATRTTSRRKGWWEQPRYRQHLTAALSQFLQFEQEATAIRVYNPSLFPGLLQTPDYALVVLDFWRAELSKEAREVRWEVRMRRRADFLERSQSSRYYLLLDESVLHRVVGGPKVMHDQLREILSFIRQGKIMARVVPYARAAPLAMLNHFSILSLDGDDDAILYQEAQLADFIEQSPPRIRLYRERFEKLWELALSEEATERLVEAKAAALLSALDRDTPDV